MLAASLRCAKTVSDLAYPADTVVAGFNALNQRSKGSR
jgi:hypothetical protein